MNVGKFAVACGALAVIAAMSASAPSLARGGGGGFSRPSGGSSGGFDFHNDAGQGMSHSSTGPAGTSRTTSGSMTSSGYDRTTTANNGNYSRTTNAGASNGQYSHNSSASNGYGTHYSSGSANANTGNYSRNAGGSNAYGSYNTQSGGNAYNHTYYHNTNASNVYGQSYHGSTTANNGYVSHSASASGPYGSAYVANPVYGGYAAWGWNGGYAWYPVPTYWGGGFWGGFAVASAWAVAYGTAVNTSGQTVTSYQVQPDSAGAKLLASYKLEQTPCGPSNLVVINGPNGSVICAKPNATVAAGTYALDASNLTLVSQKPA
ncbi:MAG: hypothetical protein JOZ38_08525 [Candidatus Eremiobacteraeota bacterium]|nr:hypothetical protein [Candidatus Eremiobacteraeota bacterium]